jgi:uncharacterized membrane-anchored protein
MIDRLMDILTALARAPYRIWGLVLAGVLMTALLAQIVAERITILTDGTEIRLATAPVDPRDLFRGDYVILTYEITSLDLDRLTDQPDSFAEGDRIYVQLTEGTDDMWMPVSVAHARPEQKQGHVSLLGRVHWVNTRRPTAETEEECDPCISARITYGIEQYFVPEGEGRALEDERNAGKVSILVAVAENGNAAIKGLVLDGGDPVYLEPLL